MLDETKDWFEAWLNEGNETKDKDAQECGEEVADTPPLDYVGIYVDGIDDCPDRFANYLEKPGRRENRRARRDEKRADWLGRVSTGNRRYGLRKRNRLDVRSHRHRWNSALSLATHTRETPIVEEKRLERYFFLGNAYAMRKWVRSHCGENWDEVYGKVAETFDLRSGMGQEIRRQIVGKYRIVDVSGRQRWWTQFYVDEVGVLREDRKPVNSYRAQNRDKKRIAPPSVEEIDALRAGRYVRVNAGKHYWCERRERWCRTTYGTGFFGTYLSFSYPQGKPLTEEESDAIGRYLRCLSVYDQPSWLIEGKMEMAA